MRKRNYTHEHKIPDEYFASGSCKECKNDKDIILPVNGIETFEDVERAIEKHFSTTVAELLKTDIRTAIKNGELSVFDDGICTWWVAGAE